MTPEEKNRRVADLIQAMLGAVSDNFRVVAISFDDGIVLTFVLRQDDAEDRDEIAGVEFEFVALQDGPVDVTTRIVVTDRPIEELTLPGRMVFLRRQLRS